MEGWPVLITYTRTLSLCHLGIGLNCPLFIDYLNPLITGPNSARDHIFAQQILYITLFFYHFTFFSTTMSTTTESISSVQLSESINQNAHENGDHKT